MLAEVHVGHLNIAEALLEMQSRPLSPEDLLSELDLQAEDVSQPMQIISVNHALGSDERFDQVGSGGVPLWFLARLEPPEALNTPPLLFPNIGRYNRAILSVELLQTEWELDDEWGESSASAHVSSVVPSISFTLIFPHWLYGTLASQQPHPRSLPAQRTGALVGDDHRRALGQPLHRLGGA